MNTAILPNVEQPTRLLTASEFVEQYDGESVELVHGKVEEITVPKSFLHGKVCFNLALLLGQWNKLNSLGHFCTNDTWIRTTRSPDSVRGPDLFFVSYERQPKDSVTEDMISAIPELVVEVSSPSDVWSKSLAKVLEYLDSGVKVVLQIIPESRSIIAYRSDEQPKTITNDQTLEIPDVFPGFTASVNDLFTL